MPAKIGILSKLYYNTGTYGAPVWIAVNLVGDLAVNFNWDEGEGTTRASRIKMFANTVANLEITGNIRSEITDTAYIALRDAAISDKMIDVLALNGASTDNTSEGFRFEGKVGQWDEDQAKGNVNFHNFSIKPVVSTNLPKAAKVTAGAPVFEDIGDQA